MKKINLKGISEILSEKELKNVMGGSSAGYCMRCANGYNRIVYGSFDSAISWFGQMCPSGGFFWDC